MSDPLPLRDPDGSIRAWACGRCLHVRGGAERAGHTADAGIVEWSRRDAAACCVCSTCGADAPLTDRECTACRDARVARQAAQRAAYVAERQAEGLIECPECHGYPIDCERCGGEGWVRQ